MFKYSRGGNHLKNRIILYTSAVPKLCSAEDRCSVEDHQVFRVKNKLVSLEKIILWYFCQITIFNVQDKITSFNKKLKYWISEVEQNNFDCFPTLEEVLIEINCKVNDKASKEILEHLHNLLCNLHNLIFSKFH